MGADDEMNVIDFILAGVALVIVVSLWVTLKVKP